MLFSLRAFITLRLSAFDSFNYQMGASQAKTKTFVVLNHPTLILSFRLLAGRIILLLSHLTDRPCSLGEMGSLGNWGSVQPLRNPPPLSSTTFGMSTSRRLGVDRSSRLLLEIMVFCTHLDTVSGILLYFILFDVFPG